MWPSLPKTKRERKLSNVKPKTANATVTWHAFVIVSVARGAEEVEAVDVVEIVTASATVLSTDALPPETRDHHLHAVEMVREAPTATCQPAVVGETTTHHVVGVALHHIAHLLGPALRPDAVGATHLLLKSRARLPHARASQMSASMTAVILARRDHVHQSGETSNRPDAVALPALLTLVAVHLAVDAANPIRDRSPHADTATTAHVHHLRSAEASSVRPI